MTQKPNYLENIRVEKFERFKLDYRLSKFDIHSNMVIYFDVENNKNTCQYIKNNFNLLEKRFKAVDRNFIFISNLDYPEKTKEILDFYLPYFDGGDMQLSFDIKRYFAPIFLSADNNINPYSKDYQCILDYLGYKGNIKSGFIFFDSTKYYDYKAQSNTSIIEYNDAVSNNDSDTFFENLVSFFNSEKQRIEEYDDMIDNGHVLYAPFVNVEDFKNLDEDTLAKVNEIKNQLHELKQSGQLLFVLPTLKQMLSNEAGNLSKSNLIIDQDYRILLPNFNNLEIQLSHLTKAVYVLFYNNSQGINIKKLYLYERQLLELYSKISYQLDYDKIRQSIEELVKPESKAIYTHISRIKSAFCKQMAAEFAINYIITTNTFGNDFKYIPILLKKGTQIFDTNESDELPF